MRRAEKFIIDTSDDHDAVELKSIRIGERLGSLKIPLSRIRCSKSARQRNLGLQFLKAPVVMLLTTRLVARTPSLDKPTILKIYEADVRRQVGGVIQEGSVVPEPPPELGQVTYKKSTFATAKGTLQPYRKSIENHFCPHPFA